MSSPFVVFPQRYTIYLTRSRSFEILTEATAISAFFFCVFVRSCWRASLRGGRGRSDRPQKHEKRVRASVHCSTHRRKCHTARFLSRSHGSLRSIFWDARITIAMQPKQGSLWRVTFSVDTIQPPTNFSPRDHAAVIFFPLSASTASCQWVGSVTPRQGLNVCCARKS